MDGKLIHCKGKRMLFVGLVCVDLLNYIEKFPQEDLGHRCFDLCWNRGGNASNSATVFSLLGGDVEFFGTLAKDRELSFIEEDFKKFGIKYDNSLVIPEKTCPFSVVILSQESHSRTVLHTNKNLPELTLDNFSNNINLRSSDYGWIHFEGRDNAYEITRMMTYVKNFNEENSAHIIISLEAEKIRLASYLDKFNMWTLPDVLFVSKDFAQNQGYTSMGEAATGYFEKVKEGAVVICAWGDSGAAAMSRQSGLVSSQAFPPDVIIDTCGAGDTFNAATLYAFCSNADLSKAIEFGCKVAGSKCGIQGFEELKSFGFTL
ncbi:ketohexokinase-like [Plakobranchus ocellatus]|uniref:Ketohexokinase-like n=1 Tax=Plakobranchus ocellatus TaxID=259542 RepID=A0AAV3ZEJ1_9GAST|nr:ketohexokinase-like [Plakobranchus ocellatus]